MSTSESHHEEEQGYSDGEYMDNDANRPTHSNPPLPLNSASSSTRSMRMNTATDEPRSVVDKPNDRIHVYVRVRPLISREASAEKVVYSKSENVRVLPAQLLVVFH